MDYRKQKNLAQSIFEKLELKVDLSGCFDKIIPQLSIDQCIQVLNLVDDKKVCSEWAYNAALIYPEHKDKVIDYVTDSVFAYEWVRKFGDRDIMRDRVTESKYAFYWGWFIGDHEIMRDRVTESEYAYCWGRHIGDREIMRDRITESEWAYWWALKIGDRKIMREKITEKEFVIEWVNKIKTNKSFFQKKFPEYFEESLVPQ